ncbi:MAG: hypothetical protein ACLQQ4_08985 [Bacteroidia bacterium]
MKKTLLFFAALSFSAAQAQQPEPYQMTPKEAEKHAREVEKSRENNTIICEYDTIFIAGVPNSLIYKVDKGALQHDDYSIRSLSGQELIYVRYCTAIDYSAAHAPNQPPPTIGYYSYVFYDTKNTGETYSDIRPFKTVGRYHLVANGTAIDPNGESNFIAENPQKWSLMQPPPPPPPPAPAVIVNNPPPPPPPAQGVVYNNPPAPQPAPQPVPPPQPVYNPPPPQPTYNNVSPAQQSPPAYNTVSPASQPQAINNNYNPPPSQGINNSVPDYALVARNFNGDIRVDQGNIYQADQQIGTIQYNEVNVNGMLTKSMVVILPNGTKVAQGYTMPNGDPHAWNVVTLKDHAQNVVNTHEGHDKEDVLWFLVKGMYL